MRGFRREVGWPSDIAVFDRDAMVIAQTTREDGALGLRSAAPQDDGVRQFLGPLRDAAATIAAA